MTITFKEFTTQSYNLRRKFINEYYALTRQVPIKVPLDAIRMAADRYNTAQMIQSHGCLYCGGQEAAHLGCSDCHVLELCNKRNYNSLSSTLGSLNHLIDRGMPDERDANHDHTEENKRNG